MRMNKPRSNGWMGVWSQAVNAIYADGGDFDDDGKPIVDGVLFFLGIQNPGADVVIPGDARYYVKGKPYLLAALLNSTSCGVRNVAVI